MINVKAQQDIPIGHKVALKDMAHRRHRHQVRHRHGQGGRADQGRRARPRAEHQDQALVSRKDTANIMSASSSKEHHLPRLPPRERPRRRAQPRHHPAAGRPVQRRRRGRGAQHQGHDGDPAPLRPAAVRRRPRPALPHADRHRLQPQRRRGGGDRHRGRLDEEGGRRHRRRPASRWSASASRATATTTPSCAPRKAAREYVQWASEKQREVCAISRAVGLHQVRRVATPPRGCGANPTVGNAFDKLHPLGNYAVLRRDHRAHRRRADRRRALRHRRGAREVHVHVQPLPGRDQPPQDQRPVRLAADQGQHRRRPDHDRGEGAGQHPEDRQEVHGRRRDRQGRDADAPGPVVHGFVAAPRPRW